MRDKMSPESHKRAEAKAQQMLDQIPLSELQRTRSLLAQGLHPFLHSVLITDYPYLKFILDYS